MMDKYKCKYCDKGVHDRHGYENEKCIYSPTKKHDFQHTHIYFSNDLRWNESFVGKNWKWLLPLAIILYFIFG